MMKKSRPQYWLLAIFLSCYSSTLMAWGPKGHAVICDIAWHSVDKPLQQALSKASKRLGYKTFAQSCAWADHIRSQRFYKWAGPLHYVNVPRYAKRVALERDCRDSIKSPKRYGHTGNDFPSCVITAIGYFQKRWQNKALSERWRDEALVFLGHFIGDLHQPLHVAYKDDRGGNRTYIGFDASRRQSLHYLWDNTILRCGKEHSWRSLSRELRSTLTEQLKYQWQQAPLLTWANESLAFTRDIYATGHRLSWSGYCQTYGTIARERLLAGGLRLAHFMATADKSSHILK